MALREALEELSQSLYGKHYTEVTKDEATNIKHVWHRLSEAGVRFVTKEEEEARTRENLVRILWLAETELRTARRKYAQAGQDLLEWDETHNGNKISGDED